MNNNPTRKQIEDEVDRDLAKKERQLLADCYEELLANNQRGVDVNVAHALKRNMALTTKLSRRMLGYTVAIFVFTIIQVAIAIASFCK